jgi:hypothetical protein
MFSASVQTDMGLSLTITRPDGRVGGQPILSFMMALLSTCDRLAEGAPASAHLEEFDRLGGKAQKTLCSACAFLMQTVVNNVWDYRDGEDYASYLARTQDGQLSEKAFLSAAEHYQQAWTELEVLIARVTTIVATLESAPLGDDATYLTADLLVDFRALHRTLLAAADRGAAWARLDMH